MFSFQQLRPRSVISAASALLVAKFSSTTTERAECRPEKPVNTDLSNATVMVTGSTGGIGEATAWRFADTAKCSRLILAGRKESKLREMKREIEAETQTKVAYVLLDVRDREACLSVIDRLPPILKILMFS